MRFSVVAAAVVAVLVGFGSTMTLVVAAARNLGADGAEVASWVGSICFSIGVSSIVLSTWTRVPVVTAWSMAGAVLLAGIPPGTSMGQAVGAFMLSGALMLLSGALRPLGALVARLPGSLGAAMLAGLLLRYVLGVFQAAQAEPWMVLPLLAAFLFARRLHAASAPLVVLALGFPLAVAAGHPMPSPAFGIARWQWTAPVFHPATLIGVGLPLFLVTMATQQIPGAAVLKVAGYEPPVRRSLMLTGALTLLTSPFGGYSTNLSSITAAICTGPDAHPDPARRWLTGPVYGLGYLVLALFGAGFAAMLAGLPDVLIAVVAGTALLAPLTNAFAAATADPSQRFAAIVAFGITASGFTLLGLGGAFWGLAGGLLVLAAERIGRG